jgi:hypothetical protein
MRARTFACGQPKILARKFESLRVEESTLFRQKQFHPVLALVSSCIGEIYDCILIPALRTPEIELEVGKRY